MPPNLTTHCPVCGEAAPLAYLHPEARIHRCLRCTHAFSDPASIRTTETYAPEYYHGVHRDWFAHPNVKLFEWIERALPSTVRSLVDVGCGGGHFLDFVRQRRPDVRLVGIDLSENADRDGVTFHCGDVLALEVGAFDAVVSLATIEHVAEANSFASRLYALCNPGGTVVVMTLDEGSLLYRAARLMRLLGVALPFDRLYSAHHLHHFTVASLARLLEHNGLRVRRTLHHGIPMRAIYVPPGGAISRSLFLSGAATLLAAGNLTGHSYLQTIVAVRGAAPDSLAPFERN